MSMFLETQVLCMIVNDALMPYVLLKVIGFRLRSQTKDKRISDLEFK